MRMVAEGVKTAISVVALGNKMGVEMPICQQVFEASEILCVRRFVSLATHQSR